MSAPVKLEIFSDYVSPWCYLSTVRVEKLQQAFDVETVLVHFPLHPDTPAEGRSMAEFYASRNIDPEAAYQRMKGLMDAEGLPYGRRTSRRRRASRCVVQGLLRRGAQHWRSRALGRAGRIGWLAGR